MSFRDRKQNSTVSGDGELFSKQIKFKYLMDHITPNSCGSLALHVLHLN